MAYEIQNSGADLVLELSGGVTVRDAAALAKQLAAALNDTTPVLLRTHSLEDIDTCILQLLVALRKTAKSFTLELPSEIFLQAVDRCALRRELLPNGKDGA